MTADERLREAFLKRMRALGGDYFEYYSIYLLERYSMKNGRRLEGMRISGGDHDGGIDGEIELTDKFGFKETIYIQSKNWDPEKGKEEYWVVGETLLQQFIGACACRQAKDGIPALTALRLPRSCIRQIQSVIQYSSSSTSLPSEAPRSGSAPKD